MASTGSWKKGQSGNPNGRPSRERSLTHILQRAGNQTLVVDGKRITGKRLVAHLVWQVATTGKCTFPDGRGAEFDSKDWLTVVKFLYTHVDGPPKSELDVTSAGQAITFNVRFADEESPDEE